MRRRAGVTLIELLAVVAVIAVIAALLLPVLASSRERARRSECAQHLRQIGMALQQYVQDFDGRYPYPTYFYGSGRHLNRGFPAQVKSRAVFWCPTGLQPYPGTFSVAECPRGTYPVPPPVSAGLCSILFSNYVYNTQLLFDPSGERDAGRAESSIPDPARFYLSSDFPDHPEARSLLLPDCPKKVYGEDFSTIHKGGANYVFADGHVEWMVPESIAPIQCEIARLVLSP